MEYDRSLLFRKYPDNKEGTYVRTMFLTFNEVIERYRRQIGEGALRNWRSMRVGTDSARYLVLSLDREQVVTKKAVRLHCHFVPRSGSDTTCGRPTATAAPAATIATAAIASVLGLCQTNFMASSLFEVWRARFADTSFCERVHGFEIEWNVFAPNRSTTGVGQDVCTGAGRVRTLVP